MPVDGLGEAVDVFKELPGEPAFADSSEPRHRDEADPLLPGGGVEELFEEPQFLFPTDKWRLCPFGSAHSSALCNNALSLPDGHRFFLTLQRERVAGDKGDCLAGGTHRRLADENRARFRGGLQAGRCVHQIPSNHSLTSGPEGHSCLAGEDTRAYPEVRCPDGSAKGCHRRYEVHRGSDGSFGVVLCRRRHSPHRHDCVADELLDGAAVTLDHPPADIEVAGEKLPDLLWVQTLRSRCEPDQVGE